MKTRLVNFRALFFIAVGLLLGITLAKDLFEPKWYVIAFFIGLIIIPLIVSLYKKSFIKPLTFIAALALGVGLFFASYSIFFPANTQSFENVTVEARVKEAKFYTSGYTRVVLSRVKLDGEKCGKNIILTTSDSTQSLKPGTHISFDGYLAKIEPYSLGEFESYYYKKSVNYNSSIAYSDIDILSYEPNILEKFQLKVKSLFDDNMTDNGASIAYAVLFGDKNDMNSELKENYSTLGIAHLLAVSGLHVGFLVLLLCWLLKKCKVGRKLQLIIVGVILAIYCCLCSFSPSVLRASIMCLVLLSARAFGKEYDSLSSISFAMILILLIKPLYAMDLGFLLSFASVFSILFISPSVEKLLIKIKTPRKLATALAVTIGVQVGVFPILAKMTDIVSIFSLLANIICIPIFQIGFCSLVVITFLVLIMPFMKFAFWLPDFCFHTINLLSSKLAIVNNSNVTITYFGKWFSLYFYMIVFVLSRFLMTTPTNKMIIATMVFTLLFSTLYLDYDYYKFRQNEIGIIQTNSGTAYVVSDEDNKKYLVYSGDNLQSDKEQINEYLKYNKIYKLTYIFSLNSNNSPEDYRSMLKVTKIGGVSDSSYGRVEGAYFNFEMLSGVDEVLSVVVSKTKICFISKSISKFGSSNIEYYFEDKNYDIIVGCPKSACLEEKNVIYYDSVKHSFMGFRNLKFSYLNKSVTNIRGLD